MHPSHALGQICRGAPAMLQVDLKDGNALIRNLTHAIEPRSGSLANCSPARPTSPKRGMGPLEMALTAPAIATLS